MFSYVVKSHWEILKQHFGLYVWSLQTLEFFEMHKMCDNANNGIRMFTT